MYMSPLYLVFIEFVSILYFKNSGHDIYFFQSKVFNGVNEGLSWFGINLMVSFQDITPKMFCNLTKISHPADLEIG